MFDLCGVVRVLCENKSAPLKDGGEDVPVNFDNRREYVDLYCKWLLESSIERQFKILQSGFNQVVDSALWSLLTAHEAHTMVCREPMLDVADMRSGARYDGYEAEEPYVNDLWKVLHSLDIPQLKKFLAFTTGADRAPLSGLKALQLIVKKNGVEPTDRLPTAQTCFNMLLLPQYESVEKLERLLLLAIEYTEGFGLQ